MYRGRLWTMRQFAGFGTADDTNERYKFLLERGQTGLSVAFDFPTLMGYDADHPRAEGEVGKCGVAISSLADMETLFDGIPLDRVSTSMTINGPAAMLFCFYVAAAERQGVPIDQLQGTIQNDILKEYMAQHAWIFPAEPALKIIVDLFEWAAEHTPKWNTISISGYHIREAGATAAQELAFTLANGFCYVEHGLARGLDVDLVRAAAVVLLGRAQRLLRGDRQAPRRAPDLGAPHARALRRRAMPAAGGCGSTARRPGSRSPRSSRTTTSCGSRTRRWPPCWAAPSRCTPTRSTRPWRCPTEESVRIALRTQQILAYETGVPNVADPLGGSYYLEALTDGLEREAEGLFAEIEAQGGVVKAIESGWFQRQIAAQLDAVSGRSGAGPPNDRRPQRFRGGGGGAGRDPQGRRRGRADPARAAGARPRAARRGSGRRAARGAAPRRRRRPQHHSSHARLRACLLHAVRDPACARGHLWQLSGADLLLIGRRTVDAGARRGNGRGRAREAVPAVAERLARLTAVDPGPHRVVSCYLKLEPRDRSRGKYLIKLKNRVREVTQALPRLGLDRAPPRRRSARDLDRVQQYLRVPANLPSTQGLALFACEAIGLFEAVAAAGGASLPAGRGR